MLAAHHRVALAEEWRIAREAALKAPRPSPEILRDLLNHKITAWHTKVVQFGKKIDWSPPSLPGDCLAGFHYFYWLKPAVDAFIQTGEKRYRDLLVDILTQYCFEPPKHPRWKSDLKFKTFTGLAVAGKWPVFLSAYLALIQSGGVPPRFIEGLLKMFLGFGRALDDQWQRFVPAYNAFSVGICTLLHVARAFPEFRESGPWDRKAIGFMAKLARVGFYADGGNRERVWGYGVMHLQGLTTSFEVARRYGGMGRHQRAVSNTIRKVCQWYARTVTPSPRCFFPTYGDAGWDAHNCLQMVRDMAGCPRSKDGFFGVDRTKSYLLKPSGFAILRSGDEPKSSYVNLSFGEFAGWHSHWDLLSMNFWSQGVPLLEELCRFGPYANPLDPLFRAPESHNQMLIDGMIYDNRGVKGEDVAWHSNEGIDYFSAYHRAYRYFVFGRGGVPVSPNIEGVVRRTVVMVKDPGYVLVLDSASSLNQPVVRAAISQYWHSPQPFQVIGPGRVRTRGKVACLLAYAQTEGLQRLETGVDFTRKEVAHLGFGHDRYSLRARRWMSLEHRAPATGFTTLLYPFTGKMPEVSVRPLKTSGGSPWQTEGLEVVTPRGRDVIVLNPEKRDGFSCEGRAVRGRGFVRLGNRRGAWVIP